MKIGSVLYTNGAIEIVAGGGGYSGTTCIVKDSSGADFATFLDIDAAIAAADALAAPVDQTESASDRSYRFARIQYESGYEIAGMADAHEAAASLASIMRCVQTGVFHKSSPGTPARNGRAARYREIIAAAQAVAVDLDKSETWITCPTCNDRGNESCGQCRGIGQILDSGDEPATNETGYGADFWQLVEQGIN